MLRCGLALTCSSPRRRPSALSLSPPTPLAAGVAWLVDQSGGTIVRYLPDTQGGSTRWTVPAGGCTDLAFGGGGLVAAVCDKVAYLLRPAGERRRVLYWLAGGAAAGRAGLTASCSPHSPCLCPCAAGGGDITPLDGVYACSVAFDAANFLWIALALVRCACWGACRAILRGRQRGSGRARAPLRLTT